MHVPLLQGIPGAEGQLGEQPAQPAAGSQAALGAGQGAAMSAQVKGETVTPRREPGEVAAAAAGTPAPAAPAGDGQLDFRQLVGGSAQASEGRRAWHEDMRSLSPSCCMTEGVDV